jgi:hypothetical protein
VPRGIIEVASATRAERNKKNDVLSGVFVNTVSRKLEFPKKVWGPVSVPAGALHSLTCNA